MENTTESERPIFKATHIYTKSEHHVGARVAVFTVVKDKFGDQKGTLMLFDPSNRTEIETRIMPTAECLKMKIDDDAWQEISQPKKDGAQ